MECPLCLEELLPESEQYCCDKCSKTIHLSCAKEMMSPECPFCRHKMDLSDDILEAMKERKSEFVQEYNDEMDRSIIEANRESIRQLQGMVIIFSPIGDERVIQEIDNNLSRFHSNEPVDPAVQQALTSLVRRFHQERSENNNPEQESVFFEENDVEVSHTTPLQNAQQHYQTYRDGFVEQLWLEEGIVDSNEIQEAEIRGIVDDHMEQYFYENEADIRRMADIDMRQYVPENESYGSNEYSSEEEATIEYYSGEEWDVYYSD